MSTWYEEELPSHLESRIFAEGTIRLQEKIRLQRVKNFRRRALVFLGGLSTAAFVGTISNYLMRSRDVFNHDRQKSFSSLFMDLDVHDKESWGDENEPLELLADLEILEVLEILEDWEEDV